MNEPIAFVTGVNKFDPVSVDTVLKVGTPLYTHPVKEQKCIVKDCENHKHEGGFVGDLCKPCYQFITTGEGIYSQAYRNSHPAKELTDEEISEVFKDRTKDGILDAQDFAKAILRKAQEK